MVPQLAIYPMCVNVCISRLLITRGLIQALLLLNLLPEPRLLHLHRQSSHHQMCRQLKHPKMMQAIEQPCLLLLTKEMPSPVVSLNIVLLDLLIVYGEGLRKVTDDQKTHKNPALRGSSKVEASATEKKSSAAPKAVSTPVKKLPVCELQGKKWVVVSKHHWDIQEIIFNTNRNIKLIIKILSLMPLISTNPCMCIVVRRVQ